MRENGYFSEGVIWIERSGVELTEYHGGIVIQITK